MDTWETREIAKTVRKLALAQQLSEALKKSVLPWALSWWTFVVEEARRLVEGW